jgi:NEDD8-activating enzyme E1 regulatory subunit
MNRSAHDNKYDRQIRLWGYHGQKALEHAHVLVLGANAVAAETMKNLVLPNLAAFTVVDQATVTPADLKSNFFLDQHAVGKSRAECVCKLVKELNPNVQGNAIVQDPRVMEETFFIK